MKNASLYAKAIIGALIAMLSAAGVALQDGAVTTPEWITIVLALLTGLAAVWATPNAQEDVPVEEPIDTPTGTLEGGDPSDETVIVEAPVVGDEDLVEEPM